MRVGWVGRREEEGFTVTEEWPLAVLALVWELTRWVGSLLVIVTSAGEEEAQMRSSAGCAIRDHARGGREIVDRRRTKLWALRDTANSFTSFSSGVKCRHVVIVWNCRASPSAEYAKSRSAEQLSRCCD